MSMFATMKSKKVGALVAVGAAAGVGSVADAAVAYTPLDITITTDGVGPSTATLAYPSARPDGGRNAGNFLVFTASTSNGVTAAKTANNTVNVFTDQSFMTPADGDPYATAYGLGEVIDITSPKQGVSDDVSRTIHLISADGQTGQFTPGSGTQYIGYNYTNGGLPFNGWIGFETTSANGSLVSAHITGVAISNQAIGAGYVPEPSSLGLLALGATGLAGYRRRKAV